MMIKKIKFPIWSLMLGIMLTTIACSSSEEDVVVPAPTSENANFTFSYDTENPNLVLFSAQPNVDTWYTHWAFGDNTSAEGNEVSRLYPLSGEYEVRFKIFTDGGSAETFQTVQIDTDLIGPNIIENGELDGDASWDVFVISGGVDVAFENSTAVWTGGGWGNLGVFQAIQVEANTTYQVDMNVSGSGLSDCWFEIYVGTIMPAPGVDYNNGGILLGLNTWDGCGGSAFDSSLTALSCSNGGGDGTFQFPSDVTAYLVIKGGGADLGETGVTIDNVSIRAL